MRLVPLEFNVWLDRARAGRFDAVIGGWQVDLSPSGISGQWGTGANSNYGKYSDPVFDSLVARASVTTDHAAALVLWHQALQVINDDAPAVWLFSPKTLAGVSNRIDNVTIRPDEWWATLWTWRAGRREAVGGGE
jgi:ABC-type transport system substrate-binding protein